MAELLTRGELEDELPGEAAVAAFMEGGSGRGNREMGVLAELAVGLLDFGEGGFLGFVGNTESSEIGEGGHLLLAAVLKEVVGEAMKVRFDSGLYDGMVGLVRLDKNLGFVKVAAPDTTDNLGKELKSAFFGSEIGQSEASVGLNNTNSGEVREIETAG